MYRLRFYENGRFCTELGGPMTTVAIAARQLREITSTIAGASEMDKVLGVKWLRSGQTPCAIVVVNELGMMIANVEEEQ